MNGVHTASGPIRVTLDTRELRSLNEDLGRRLGAAIADITTIKQVAKSNHVDPHSAIEDLQCVMKFSEIPKEFTRRKARTSFAGVDSIVKHEMKNDEYRGALTHRSANGAAAAAVATTSSPLNIANLSNPPLKLSFDARREKIMKSHNARTESSISGLFSKNPQAVPGAPQGPVPQLYTPPPTARRFEIEAAKEARVAQMMRLGKQRSTEAILSARSVPKLHGCKVAKDFIPACAEAEVGDKKAAVQKRLAEEHAKVAGKTPFK